MIASCRRLVATTGFQRFITLVILVAGALVGMETSHALMARHGDLIHALDQVVLAIFIAEIALRLIAEAPRPWRYFADPWNCFDFLIVVGAILPFVSSYVTVLRLFRLLRVLRLVRAVPRLQVLVGALLHSLPSMGYVVLLLGLLFYIYGVAGVFFFGAAAPQHFGDLGGAFFTLFQVVTLEDWVEVLNLAVGGGVDSTLAIAYFVSFILIGTMVMLNLVIGIVLEGMKESQAVAFARARPAGSDDAASELAALEADLARITERMARLGQRMRTPPDRS
ncbi:MAG: ion transporter [Deltaproteobacteria bacterium]|nr:ion transporter [Deltaproteobacteria bacterium]